MTDTFHTFALLFARQLNLFDPNRIILVKHLRLVFSSQDEKNQVLTTNIWLEQVRCHRRRSFDEHSSMGSRNGTINA